MPRFVILTHDHPNLHWDLMLESDGTLRTWRLSDPPQAGSVVHAEPIPDHRLAYLEYEGPVSGGRGTVTRWDRGTYTGSFSPEGEWSVCVVGEQLNGTLTLTPGDAGWSCRFHPGRG